MIPFNTISAIEPAGMNAIILYFHDLPLLEANKSCQRWTAALDAVSPEWLAALLPSYDSLVISFHPELIDSHGVYRFIHDLKTSEHGANPQGREHTIPVWYGAKGADDLHLVGEHTGLSSEEVISLHSGKTYRVFAVGFAPGFAYLGELDDKLACPRLSSPRQHVPQGAVAIADRQTAIYPAESPGGWHLLGLTPVPMFNAKEARSLLNVGDLVTYVPISEQEFKEAQHGR
ncbi:5-oxoprolinase subunit B family protein [Alteromonas sp. H39]|uniref:5-oxoprolinase subunit B family protein n=1 Tax=Alteromonas sp. H39 TaxID=3389876 RepID=UPI0039E0B3BA